MKARCKQIQFYLLFFCLSSSFSIEAQETKPIDTANFKCTYQFKFLTDSIKMEYKEKEMYIVQIGNNFTKGYCYQTFFLDSLTNTPDGGKKWGEAMTALGKSVASNRANDPAWFESFYSLTRGFFQFYVYKDYEKDKITVTDNIGQHYFYYDDELKPQDWTILEDTTTVLGYFCQKAICQWRGREWEAWFSSEIPINEGPWKFYGLPGLIMNLQDTELQYSFNIIGLQRVNEPMYMTIKKNQLKTDRLTFLKLKMKVTGVDLNAIDLEKMGFTPNTEELRYDEIERDYR